MLSNAQEFNAVGGGPGYGAGGFGGFGGLGAIGLFGLIGLDTLRGRKGDDDCCDGNRNLAVLAAIASAKDTTVAEGRDLAAAICETKAQSAAQAYAAAIQVANSTQAVKDQATAFAIVADKRFDDLAAAGVAQTAAIIAKINQTEIDSLRDQLHETRRGRDAKDVEITIQQTVNQAQAQAQAQFQTQKDEFRNHFALLAAQLNKTSNDVINFGTMAASGNQANQQTNIK